MTNNKPLSFLCISGEFKGIDFLKACKAAGNKVYLVTSKTLEHSPWPREILDDIFFMEDKGDQNWNMDDFKKGLAFFMRSNPIDRIVAMDDFDVEKAAHLREYFRIPGMGETTYRYFRDKLAMRMKAAEEGLKVPPFSALFHDDAINHFIQTVPAPWVLKPRSEASATGIQKVHTGEALWEAIHALGEERPNYLVEQFKPGSVYHVDALSVGGKQVFVQVSQYLNTPFEVAHGGGIFRSHTIPYNSKEDKALKTFNRQVLKAFGMEYSASHTEYIQSEEDGEFYFLETSSRVGGAHLADMVAAASGINLWQEWAKIETASAKKEVYKLPKRRKEHAGIIVSLSRFQQPDTTSFTEEEIVWRMQKDYHIGLVLQTKDRAKILSLLDDYAKRIFQDFHAMV
jgi:hypothetical protein